MSHVLEHLVDFRSLLARARKLLVPRGVLAIQAPNRNSLANIRYGVDYRPVEHPFYWTYRSLYLAVKAAGLLPVVAPTLRKRWTASPDRAAKEVALLLERHLASRFNLGIKSTLEVHAVRCDT
jgi:hypothetical protein